MSKTYKEKPYNSKRKLRRSRKETRNNKKTDLKKESVRENRLKE